MLKDMVLEEVLGSHIICELRGCEFDKLNDVDVLTNLLIESCKLGGATVIGHVAKGFTPQGATSLILLSESHCSIHTWPEKGYAALDIFTCGGHVNGKKIFDRIHDSLGGEMTIYKIKRGLYKSK